MNDRLELEGRALAFVINGPIAQALDTALTTRLGPRPPEVRYRKVIEKIVNFGLTYVPDDLRRYCLTPSQDLNSERGIRSKRSRRSREQLPEVWAREKLQKGRRQGAGI